MIICAVIMHHMATSVCHITSVMLTTRLLPMARTCLIQGPLTIVKQVNMQIKCKVSCHVG